MKKAIFGLQENPGPWTIGFLRKTRFRDIFENPTFWIFSLFGPSPLTRWISEKKIYKKKGLGKKTRPPPRPRGARGGTPHSGRSPELNQPLKS